MHSAMFLLSWGLSLVFGVVKGTEINYKRQYQWYEDYSECRGHKQSPIELKTKEAILCPTMEPLVFRYYGCAVLDPVVIQNNGYTANIVLSTTKKAYKRYWQVFDKLSAYITGGPLSDDVYIAESIHFHWGSKSFHGSEHVVDGRRYALEMHIVHRNAKYKNISHAQCSSDGLAVLAVFYNEDDSSDFTGLSCIVSALYSINNYKNKIPVKKIVLGELLGSINRENFFTYEGSLTTPPCSEAVTWIVFNSPIAISAKQLKAFRTLTDINGDLLENNYRFLQPIGKRKVWLHVDKKSSLPFNDEEEDDDLDEDE